MTFLTLDEVLAIHADQIEQYDGALGIRDTGLLESALATPQAAYGGNYLHGDLHEMAAAYLYHIVQIHPFLHGNKRAGLMAAIIFLGLNDYRLTASPKSLLETVLGVASGTVSKSEVAVYLKQNTQPESSW